jgi:hypothetical protein
LSIGSTRTLPFDWDRFFVTSETECALACYAISARYWKSYYPELNLPTDIEVWKEFAAESFVPYRGTSIRDIVRKMPNAHVATKVTLPEEVKEAEGIVTQPKKFLDLVIKHNTPKGLESLIPFFQTRPPIPQILVFDRLLMTHNITGTYHAVILYSLDFEKEKLFVIDPTKVRLVEPDVYDFHLFKKAWRGYQNLQIITYPKGKITIISGPLEGIVKQPKITEFMEGHI